MHDIYILLFSSSRNPSPEAKLELVSLNSLLSYSSLSSFPSHYVLYKTVSNPLCPFALVLLSSAIISTLNI